MPQNLLIRLSIIVICGLFFAYKIFGFKYSVSVFEVVLLLPVAIVALLLWLWSVFIDLRLFKTNKEKVHLLSTFLGSVLLSITTIIYHCNQQYFNKPNLLKIYCDGDFNGTGIDFNTDGEYVFYNSSWGSDTYDYGSYQIIGDTLKLDKNKIDNVIESSVLIIKSKEIEYASGAKIEKYAFQINDKGNIQKNSTQFRVVIDNRK